MAQRDDVQQELQRLDRQDRLRNAMPLIVIGATLLVAVAGFTWLSIQEFERNQDDVREIYRATESENVRKKFLQQLDGPLRACLMSELRGRQMHTVSMQELDSLIAVCQKPPIGRPAGIASDDSP